MDKICGQLDASGEAVDHLHGVQGHVHVDEGGEVLGDLGAAHEVEQALVGEHGVVVDEVGEEGWCEAAAVHEAGVGLEAVDEDLLLLGLQGPPEGEGHEVLDLGGGGRFLAHGGVPEQAGPVVRVEPDHLLGRRGKTGGQGPHESGLHAPHPQHGVGVALARSGEL